MKLSEIVKSVSTFAGVYKMLDKNGTIIYVGKAKNLKKRLSSYLFTSKHDAKTESLVAQIASVETIVTANENEALLLENNLIKLLRPRYNILFKDDKSYPYLLLTQHTFPRLCVHRGARNIKGYYFGPFSNIGSIRDILNLLQKIFKLRQCGENFFRNRTRPCIQYQIKRCSAPCVDYIDEKNYAVNVDLARKFLKGQSNEVIQNVIALMEKASTDKDYETAAYFRDQILSLKKIQQQQYVVNKDGDVDAISLVTNPHAICIGIISIRKGLVLGSKTYFKDLANTIFSEEILSTFLSQYYLNIMTTGDAPRKIYIDVKLDDRLWLQDAISQSLQSPIKISDNATGVFAKWIEMARVNALHVLNRNVTAKAIFFKQLQSFQTTFHLVGIPKRIECFDVSHSGGEATVASCVAFDERGPYKKGYRKYNIKNGFADDYGALKEALTRHFTKVKESKEKIPDVLIIDGGKGQLNIANQVLEELQVVGIFLLTIAKGPSRKPGLEEIYLSNHERPISLNPESPTLHMLQQVRDEAHRFAITGQRRQLANKRKISILENIPGIGKAKRTLLLTQFGGLQGIKTASVEELAKIKGINLKMAQKIYDYLRNL